MDNASSEKEANEIYINFNNENYEFDHDYTKPFSRSKSIVERSSYSKDDSIQTDTYRSKRTNNNDESNHLNEIKKQFFHLIEEFNYHQNHLNGIILSKERIEQAEFENLFAFVEKQNNLLKEVLPYLSLTSEIKKSTLNDKLKNNFINKIYELETKLSDKENIISQLTDEIQSLKSQNLNNRNIDTSNDLENSENKSEQINDSINSPPKSSYNGFVNIARNSIYSNNKLPLTDKTPLINRSEASNKQANQKSNDDINILNNLSQINVNKFEIDNFENQNGNNNDNDNVKPELYQRKKNEVINGEQRSRSFCHANEIIQSVGLLDFNFSVLNENEINNSCENENKEIKIYFAEEPEINKVSSKVNKIPEQTESQSNLVFEKQRKSLGKARGRNISLPDFNSLYNPKDINEYDNDDINYKNNNNNIEIELKNNSFTDITENVYIENTTNSNAIVTSNPHNDSNNISSPENKNSEINKKHLITFNKINNLKGQEILNKIKDSFLSLSSYDNSLNSSLNNISHLSNKSGNNSINRESDNKKIRRNKSLFKDRTKINPEEDEANFNNYSAKRKSQNFSYLNLLINNKNPYQSKKESNINYDSDKENSEFDDSQNPRCNRDEPDKFKNNCKELNLNLINETLKLNSNDSNLISNSPIHHNLDAINNQLNLFNYKSFKKNDNYQNNQCIESLKFDKSKDAYGNQTGNEPVNKSKSVVIKNRRNRDYKNYINNFNNPKNKIEKKFAEDNYIINSEHDMNTEPINNNVNEKFYLEKLAFDINLQNMTRLKNETSKNKQISSRFLKETLFKNEDELINLNSDETQGNSNNNHIYLNVNDKQNMDNQIRVYEQKEELNFSFNNSKNNIKVFNNCNNEKNSASEIKDKARKKPSLKDSNAKNVKKISMVRNDYRNIAVKKPLNEKKGVEIKSSENKNAEVINTTEENNNQNVKEIKFQNAYLNKKLHKDNNPNNSKALNTKESLEQATSSMVSKSKEYSKNIKAQNDKNIKKLKVKSTNDSKADPENNTMQNNNNNDKSKVSSVKMRKNYEESLSQNRNNLLNKLNKKSNNESNNNNKNNNDNNNNKSTNNLKENHVNSGNNNLNSERTKINLFSNSPLHLVNNGLKNLSKKTHFSKSTCDLKNEIYLNINKDAVFSLKPDECLNLSENEYISNKESSKNEYYKESCENVFSLENEKTPSEKRPKNLIKESSINKISEDISYDADVGAFANFNNKFTLSHRDLLLPNNNDDKNFDNRNYFDRVGNESKRLTSRSKSFVEFDKIIINEKTIEEGEIKNKKSSNNALKNKVKKNEDLLKKITEQNKEKIEIISSNLNKNLKKEKEKGKLDTSLNDSTKGLNQTQSSISFNFINNISINAPGDSSFVIEDNDKPATYTKKLLAKYYKYVDDYNKRINIESNKTTKNWKLDDSKASKSTNKK